VYFTRVPVAAGAPRNQFRKPNPPPKAPPPRVVFPVPRIPLIIRPGMQIPLPNVVPPPLQIGPIDATQMDTKNAPLTNQDSVKQLPNQCAPASVANSLQYLMVNDGNMNVPSGMPNSRVAALDTAMGRQAGKGTPTLKIIQGKLKYINQKGGLNLVVKHQGRFCPGVNQNDPACQQGQITDDQKPAGAVTSMPGTAGGVDPKKGTQYPKPAFITSEIDMMEDVEMCFIWPTGAHCVQVTGYNWEKGFLALTIIQDAAQGQAGDTTSNKVKGAHMTVHVGMTADGRLWIQDWPGGPALVTNVTTESPNGM
jgi:hypothetical protein